MMKPKEAVLVYSHRGKQQKISIAPGEQQESKLFSLGFQASDSGIHEVKLNFKGEELTVLSFFANISYAYDEKDQIFVNGWQSWSESREYGLEDRRKKLNALAGPLLSTYGDYRFAEYGSAFSSWSYSYVRTADHYLLLGAFDEQSGFVQIQHYPGKGYIKIAKDAGGLKRRTGSLSLKFGLYQGDEDAVFNQYFDQLGYCLKPSSRVLGWTSWYNYYTAISEDIILSNLRSFSEHKLPIDLFQIDDGYQTSVGDWLSIKDSFPRGMGYLAESIKDLGYRAGIWLAPFVCSNKSEIYKKHPDWLARDAGGKPLKAGFNPMWGGFFYTLDFYNPAVRSYLEEVFAAVFTHWRYDMVKLDFLYAVTLIQRSDKTSGEMMHEAMAFLRNLADGKLILGCGVPLSAAYGTVDFCRIGSDVGLTWEDPFLRGINYRERVSTLNSLGSTLSRRHLNSRVFKNDPDVFILREKNQKMSLSERKVLLYMNMLLGGLIFTSDHIGEYSAEEMKLYRDALQLRDASVLRVWTDKLVYIEAVISGIKELFIFNLSETAHDLKLEGAWEHYGPNAPGVLSPRNMNRFLNNKNPRR